AGPALGEQARQKGLEEGFQHLLSRAVEVAHAAGPRPMRNHLTRYDTPGRPPPQPEPPGEPAGTGRCPLSGPRFEYPVMARNDALLHLLTPVGRHADLLTTQPVIPEFGRGDANTFLGGLLALARHPATWLRPVEEWRPATHNARRQFASLARHLFAVGPVPPF